VLERIPLPESIARSRLVAVVRATSIDTLPNVVSVLIENGITVIELTLTTPDAIRSMTELRSVWSDRALIGMGTVTTKGQARDSIAAGAQFLVTPITVPEIANISSEAGVPILMGAFSPTEVATAWDSGATAVKVFPASQVGPSYLRELRGPFLEIVTMPSGGVTIDDIPAWLSAGASAVSLGGSLIGSAFSGDLAGLAERARKAVDYVAKARY
jgi:2-dehydro-3-deoxyphosphogluconate aldolase/(4S)-4-hydroxy-2-oxoglutarate aldolase